ncbi:hypothetical protein CHUAL_006757 [Chamberlinius hualienensis]
MQNLKTKSTLGFYWLFSAFGGSLTFIYFLEIAVNNVVIDFPYSRVTVMAVELGFSLVVYLLIRKCTNSGRQNCSDEHSTSKFKLRITSTIIIAIGKFFYSLFEAHLACIAVIKIIHHSTEILSATSAKTEDTFQRYFDIQTAQIFGNYLMVLVWKRWINKTDDGRLMAALKQYHVENGEADLVDRRHPKWLIIFLIVNSVLLFTCQVLYVEDIANMDEFLTALYCAARANSKKNLPISAITAQTVQLIPVYLVDQNLDVIEWILMQRLIDDDDWFTLSGDIAIDEDFFINLAQNLSSYILTMFNVSLSCETLQPDP